MAKTAEFKQPLTPSMLAEICEASPAYHGKLAAERKLSELKAKLSSNRARQEAWNVDWNLLHNSEAQKTHNSDIEQFLDKGIIPESKSRVEAMEKEKANLRDEETLLRGAIELQKWRVMEAKNAYISSVMPQLKAMHKQVFRQYLSDCLAMNKKSEAIRAIHDEGDRWELPLASFQCGVPWIHYPGKATDISSGLQVSLRLLVENDMISEVERVSMLRGGEFIP